MNSVVKIIRQNPRPTPYLGDVYSQYKPSAFSLKYKDDDEYSSIKTRAWFEKKITEEPEDKPIQPEDIEFKEKEFEDKETIPNKKMEGTPDYTPDEVERFKDVTIKDLRDKAIFQESSDIPSTGIDAKLFDENGKFKPEIIAELDAQELKSLNTYIFKDLGKTPQGKVVRKLMKIDKETTEKGKQLKIDPAITKEEVKEKSDKIKEKAPKRGKALKDIFSKFKPELETYTKERAEKTRNKFLSDAITKRREKGSAATPVQMTTRSRSKGAIAPSTAPSTAPASAAAAAPARTTRSSGDGGGASSSVSIKDIEQATELLMSYDTKLTFSKLPIDTRLKIQEINGEAPRGNTKIATIVDSFKKMLSKRK